MTTTAHSRVLGSGFVVGEHRVKNADLAKICDTSDEWIKERSGIEQRYFVKDGVATSDLGVGAAKKALEDARLAAERDRLHRGRHHDARLLLPGRGQPRPGEARAREHPRAGHPPAVQWLHLRPAGLRRAHPRGRGDEAALHRRRGALGLHAVVEARLGPGHRRDRGAHLEGGVRLEHLVPRPHRALRRRRGRDGAGRRPRTPSAASSASRMHSDGSKVREPVRAVGGLRLPAVLHRRPLQRGPASCR